MPRFIYQGTWTDGNGVVVSGGTVTVYLAGTTTKATIYAAATGDADADSAITSGTDGHFYFYVDTDDYGLGQRFKIILSKTSFTSKTYDNVEIFPKAVDASLWTSFAAAVAAIDSTETTLTISNSQTVSADVTLPSTLCLEFQYGGRLNVASGVTLTIHSPEHIIASSGQQVFTGDGTVAWTSSAGTVYVLWFGKNTTPGTTSMTTAIQDALNSAPAILEFGSNATYLTGALEIKANIHIKGNGATLQGSGNGLFNVLTALDKLYIEGLTVTWSTATGTIYKQFLWNTDDAAASTGWGTGTVYAITDVQIWNNNFGASRIELQGATTEARIYNNKWIHGSGVGVAPAYLMLQRGAVDSNSGPVWITDNIFDVYGPTSANADIVKVSGGTTEANISGNYFRNRNVLCCAQVDMFTGAHKMRFVNNTLINVTLVRKQIDGAITAPQVYHYDLIMGNSFENQDTFDLAISGVYWIGALGTIIGNQFILLNPDIQQFGIYFDNSDIDITYDTDETVAKIVANNLFYLSDSKSTSQAIKQDLGAIGSTGGRGTVISGNILLGGSDLVDSYSKYSSYMGNVWLDSGGAAGTSVNAGPTSIVIGNVADTTTPVFTGMTSGNLVQQDIATLANDATPSVLGIGKYVLTGGTTTITDLDDGYTGQEITIMAEHTITITDGTNIFLNGAANFDMADTDTLTLVCKSDNKWYEVARSDNTS